MSVSSKELFSSLAPGQDPSGFLLTGPGVGLWAQQRPREEEEAPWGAGLGKLLLRMQWNLYGSHTIFFKCEFDLSKEDITDKVWAELTQLEEQKE